jgi:hypothetical protein
MRTAEEIIKSVAGVNDMAFWDRYINRPSISISEALIMISEARKEAIELCAKNAKVSLFDFIGDSFKEFPQSTSGYSINDGTYVDVDKQSILSLINELK